LVDFLVWGRLIVLVSSVSVRVIWVLFGQIREDLYCQVSGPPGLVRIHHFEYVGVDPGGLGSVPEVRGWVFFLVGYGIFEFVGVFTSEEVFDGGDP
jgi:hypothetical protein